MERDPRITVLIHSSESDWDWAEVRGHVVGVIGGEEARAQIDALTPRYVGTDDANPIGPGGRVILQVAPDKINTPKSLAR